MTTNEYKLLIGALLHDIGKVVYRAGNLDSRAHPVSGQALVSNYIDDSEINEIILYHHAKNLKNAGLHNQSLAYIVYCADNIAAAVDRREIEGETKHGFNSNTPLASIFNLLNDNQTKLNYRAEGINKINFPSNIDYIEASVYNKITQELKAGLSAINWQPEYINSVLELLEAYLSYIPSSTHIGEVADISLYDHQRLTAAIAVCIYQYLISNNRNDFKAELFLGEENFRKEKAFLLFSCDISGIQQFIYTISSKGALKALRSRSFYLEILLEHIVDLLLNENNISRTNLIYTGGGHAYILFPNTASVKESCSKIIDNVNKWFINNMGTSLFIAYALEQCSCNDLINIPYEKKPYQTIFQNLSRKLSAHKLKRYKADDIRRLNNTIPENWGRECKSCGSVHKLLDTDDVCAFCSSLQKISRQLVKKDVLVVSSYEPITEEYVTVPSVDGSNNYLSIMTENELRNKLQTEQENIFAVYATNKMYTGLKYSTRLWMGNYYYSTNGDMPTFEELAKHPGAEIERIAVLRADVDNLGAAFVSGFIRSKETNEYERNRYLTLSRTASLSRQLSMFFKYHINSLLEGKIDNIDRLNLSNLPKHSAAKRAVIVYSGGDDLFIVGSWEEVIELAADLRQAFKEFTANSLTFSGGIGLYPEKYPVNRMALETAELEDAAKKIDDTKDAVALFGMELNKDNSEQITLSARHLYKWDEFTNKVINQKLRLIQNFFALNKANEQAKGNSFLYKLKDYITNVEEDKINIARFAYLLGRLAPPKKSSAELVNFYHEFADYMYGWILNEKDRKELLTAINLYVYLTRNKEGKDYD